MAATQRHRQGHAHAGGHRDKEKGRDKQSQNGRIDPAGHNKPPWQNRVANEDQAAVNSTGLLFEQARHLAHPALFRQEKTFAFSVFQQEKAVTLPDAAV